MLKVSGTILLALRNCRHPFYPRDSRGLHLLHHMFTKHPIGFLAAVKKKPLPPAYKVSFHLLDIDGSDLGIVSLKDALLRIKPGTYLTEVDLPNGHPQYQIKTLTTPSSPPSLSHDPKKKKRKFQIDVKKFHLTTQNSSAHLRYVLETSYEFLLKGERIEMRFQQKRHGPEHMTIDWALEHRPNLRPDTILRAMPEGTQMIAHPCIAPDLVKKAPKSAAHIQWAMEYEPSSERLYGRAPNWMKKMGTWDVELKLDPTKDRNQKVEHMFRYSERLQADKAKRTTSQESNLTLNDPEPQTDDESHYRPAIHHVSE